MSKENLGVAERKEIHASNFLDLILYPLYRNINKIFAASLPPDISYILDPLIDEYNKREGSGLDISDIHSATLRREGMIESARRETHPFDPKEQDRSLLDAVESTWMRHERATYNTEGNISHLRRREEQLLRELKGVRNDIREYQKKGEQLHIRGQAELKRAHELREEFLGKKGISIQELYDMLLVGGAAKKE